MDKSSHLGTQNILSLIIKNSLPAIAANLVFALYNIVDRVFIGKGLGTQALAGVTITFPFFTLCTGIGLLVGIGSGILVSIKIGERKKAYAELVLGNVVFLFFIFSLLITVFGFIFMNDFLTLFGANNITLSYAKSYVGIILPFLFFQFLVMGMNNIIRAESNAKMAMITIVISCLLNAILDPIFIFYFKMGVEGAAIATVISIVVSSIWIIYHFTKSKNRVLSLKLKNLKPNFKIISRVLKLGFPSFFMQLLTTLTYIVLNRELVKFSHDLAISAMGIVQTIFFTVLMLIVGLNQGAQPIIGYNFGAKNFKRVKNSLLYTLLLSLTITIPVTLAIIFFKKTIVNLFCKNDLLLLELASRGCAISFCLIILIGFNITVISFLQSIGDIKKAMMLNFTRQILIFFPVIYILPKIFGLDGVWLVAPTEDFLIFCVILFVLFKKLKHLDAQHLKFKKEDLQQVLID